MKELKIRQLKFNDAYKLAAIIAKVKVDPPKELLKMEDSTLKGVLIMKDSLKHLKLAQNEINDFLGGLFGISGKEFGNLSLKESMEAMKQLQEIEGVKDFLVLVKGLKKQYF